MTKPQISNQISLGNVIQILILLVGLAGAYYTLKATSDTASVAAVKNADGLEKLADRVQVLETRDAVNGEQISVLRRDIEEIKNGQRETNNLMRQLLQHGVIPR